MVRIRLTRGGVKNKPFYRIVAIDSKRKREGKPLEVLGYWNPDKDDLSVDQKKVDKWLDSGAQMSDKVRNLIEANSKPRTQ